MYHTWALTFSTKGSTEHKTAGSETVTVLITPEGKGNSGPKTGCWDGCVEILCAERAAVS